MDFTESKSDILAQNSNGSSAEVTTKYAVVFLVEATGKLHRHMETLKSAYLSPILSYFRSTSSGNDNSGFSWQKNVVYGFIFYYSADAAKGQEVYCDVEPNDNEEATLQWFDTIPVDRAPFIHAHQACLLEAIAAGIGYINRLIARHFAGEKCEKHFIIAGQSAPYEEPLLPSTHRPQTFQDAAHLIAEQNVHLSVINTRRSKLLRVLFNDSRDIDAFAETTSNINDQHMVLLNNISIRPARDIKPVEINLTSIPAIIENHFSPISAPPIPDLTVSRNFDLEEKPTSSILQGILDGPQFKRSPAPDNLLSTTLESPLQMFHSDSPKNSRNSPMLDGVKYPIPIPVPNLMPGNKQSTIPVARLADEVSSQYARQPANNIPPSMARVNSGSNLMMYPQQGNNQGTSNPNRVVGEKLVLWEGILEWAKSVPQGPPNRGMHEIQSEIWVPAVEPVMAERWPPKLTINFLPPNMAAIIKPFMEQPIKVNFTFKQPTDALKELHDKLVNPARPNSFGSIMFSTPTHPIIKLGNVGLEKQTVELRVMLFVYSAQVRGFQGYIPRDQVGFVDALRQLSVNAQAQRQRMEQQRQLQMQQQQQQQQQNQINQMAPNPQQQINNARQGANQYGSYGEANFMPQQNNPQQQQATPNMGYPPQNQMLPNQQQQQQQNMRNMMFQQQQMGPGPQNGMQMGQPQINPQDPQLRALLQNSSPHLHASMQQQFDK